MGLCQCCFDRMCFRRRGACSPTRTTSSLHPSPTAFICYSHAKKCDWHSNKWSPRKKWKTSSVITGLAIRSQNRLRSLTTPTLMPRLSTTTASSLDPSYSRVHLSVLPSPALYPRRTRDCHSTLQTTLALVLAVAPRWKEALCRGAGHKGHRAADPTRMASTGTCPRPCVTGSPHPSRHHRPQCNHRHRRPLHRDATAPRPCSCAHLIPHPTDTRVRFILSPTALCTVLTRSIRAYRARSW